MDRVGEQSLQSCGHNQGMHEVVADFFQRVIAHCSQGQSRADTSRPNNHQNNANDDDESSSNDNDQYSRNSSSASFGSLTTTQQNQQQRLTLYFDRDKNRTILVLTQPPTQHLAVYLQCRIEQGTASQRSALYYELEGFVRENKTKLQPQLQCCLSIQGSLVQVCENPVVGNETHPSLSKAVQPSLEIAFGALEASDNAQIQEIEREHKQLWRDRNQSRTEQEKMYYLNVLDRAMEIACMHRLEDDLDVLSIHFLYQTNRVLRRAAVKLAKSQLASAQRTHIVVSPFMDGVSLSGYSTFLRGTPPPSLPSRNDNGDPAAESDPVVLSPPPRLAYSELADRTVEYQQYPNMLCTSEGQEPGDFVPSTTTGVDACCSPIIRWKCEEFALANLQVGKIVATDYVGHKFAVSWEATAVEPFVSNAYANGNGKSKSDEGIGDSNTNSNSDASNRVNGMSPVVVEHYNKSLESLKRSIPLGTVYLEPCPVRGIRSWPLVVPSGSTCGIIRNPNNRTTTLRSSSPRSSSSHKQSSCYVTFRILESRMKNVDRLTISYAGSLMIVKVHVTMDCLLAAAARHVWKDIHQHYESIRDYRPLLPHEQDYLQQIIDLAS